MKSVILVNIINLLILGVLILCLAFNFNKVVVYTLLVFWACFVIYSNYNLVVRRNNIITALEDADTKGIFKNQIKVISKAYNSIVSMEDFYSKYKEEDSIRSAYSLLKQKITSNVVKATKYISSYDYVSKPSSSYLNTIARDSTGLIDKLSELYDLVLRVEDSASSVDITYVDDMLDALRKVVEDERE